MEIEEFLRQTQAEVRSEIAERLGTQGASYPFPEVVFAENVMAHMAEIGMTFEPVACHYEARIGNAKVRLSGYSVSDDADQLDLFVSLYGGVDAIEPVPDAETKNAAEQCLRFLAKCAEGKLAATMDESNDAYVLAMTIQGCYGTLDQIRVYVLTDRLAKSKQFKPREIRGKTVKLEVMDIERLYRHLSEGKPRDELVVNFEEVTGSALSCVYVPGEVGGYDYAVTVIPAEALRYVYERFGARLLEANVRSFLSNTGKVNKGIRDTLRNDPERFMAYNNGIVVVADDVSLGKAADGGTGIVVLKGMQIVNGGQTTASIYFGKKRDPDIDLARVWVPAKVIVLRSRDTAAEEAMISDISRFANTQNAVRQSDLSANKPFHVELEKLAMTTYCPDGVGRWFYERSTGSYNTMLAREGTTPAKLRKLRQEVNPPSRKITKTDLAKYVNAWAQKPDAVSTGAQKNFARFMQDLVSDEAAGEPRPTVSDFKAMVAKAIVFKRTQSLIRPMFPAFQANVAAYAIALLANRLGDRVDLERIWANQGISAQLADQIRIWAREINDVLHATSGGRMISEWAKKPECWEAVRDGMHTAPIVGITELAR